MQKAGEYEVRVFANPFAIKTGEERGGAGSVETLVVIEDSNFQSGPQFCKSSRRPHSHIRSVSVGRVKANRNDSLEEESQGVRSGSVCICPPSCGASSRNPAHFSRVRDLP